MSAVDHNRHSFTVAPALTVTVLALHWIVPGLGVLIGLVMLWGSAVWDRLAKAIGTLLPIASGLAALIVFTDALRMSAAAAYVALIALLTLCLVSGRSLMRASRR
jgi:hypothetical protein